VSGESIWDITLVDDLASEFYSVILDVTKSLTITFNPLPPVPLPVIEWEGVTDEQGRYLGFVNVKITTVGELIAMNQSTSGTPQCFDGGVSASGDLFFRSNASVTAIACETFDLKRSSELASETRVVIPSFFALVNLIFSYNLDEATPMDEALFVAAVARVLNIDARRVVDVVSNIVDPPGRRRNLLLHAATSSARRQGGRTEYREVQFKVLANSQQSAESLGKAVTKEKLQAQLNEEGVSGVNVESLQAVVVDGSVIPDIPDPVSTGLRIEEFIGIIIGGVVLVVVMMIFGHFVQKRRRQKVEEEDRQEERKLAKQQFLEQQQQQVQVSIEPSYTTVSDEAGPTPTTANAPVEPDLSHQSEEEISAFRAWKNDVRRQKYGSEQEEFAAWQKERTRLRESGQGLLDPPKVKPSAAEVEAEERKSRRHSKKDGSPEKEGEEGAGVGEGETKSRRRKKGSKKESEIAIEGVTSPTAGTPREGEGASPASAQNAPPETPVGETPNSRAARKKLKPLGIGSKQVRSMRESAEITEAAGAGVGSEGQGDSPGGVERSERRRSRSPAKGERARSPVGPNRPEEYQEYDRNAALQQMASEGDLQTAAAPQEEAGVDGQV